MVTDPCPKLQESMGFSVFPSFRPFIGLGFRALLCFQVLVLRQREIKSLTGKKEIKKKKKEKRRAKMDSFSTGSSGTGSPQISTEEFMDQMKLQLAQAYAQEFLETVREKCFDKCITKPGSSLSGSESSCISRCVDRYIEATGIISKALFNAPR